MSHTTKLKSIIIRDVQALRQAANALVAMGVPCKLVENSSPRMYYSNQQGKCAYVLKLENSQYDVGFERQNDGSYVPVFDEWGGHVSNQLGASCPVPTTPEGRAQHQIGKFFQQYAKAAAINAAVVQGYTVETADVMPDGTINLVMAGM